jgi:GxxExxY protein
MRPVDRITDQIIGGAIRLHKKYGAGLLESVYTPCLAHELLLLGLEVEVGKPISLAHEGLTIHRAYVLDLLVEGQVIVEVKCVSSIAPIHVAQLLTYLRLLDLRVGLIINFNVTKLVNGIKRVVNEHVDEEGNRL